MTSSLALQAMLVISMLSIGTMLAIIVLVQARRIRRLKLHLLNAEATSERFCELISHEIRTPMNGVMGNLDLLDGPTLKPEQKHQINRAKAAAETLVSQLEDILSLTVGFTDSATHTGQESFEPAKFCHQVIAEYQIHAALAGTTLKLEADPGLPQRVEGPARALRIAARHLISNAIRYGQSKEISIELSCHSDADGRDHTLGLRVRDQGNGVPEKTSQSLFNLFGHLRSVDHEATGSAGIGRGLPISKRVIESAGGKIGFLSRKQNGSVFWVRIPIKVLQQFSDRQQTTIDHSVLLIDDNDARGEIFADYLAMLGQEQKTGINACRGKLTDHLAGRVIIIADSSFMNASSDEQLNIKRLGGIILDYGNNDVPDAFKAMIMLPYSAELLAKLQSNSYTATHVSA